MSKLDKIFFSGAIDLAAHHSKILIPAGLRPPSCPQLHYLGCDKGRDDPHEVQVAATEGDLLMDYKANSTPKSPLEEVSRNTSSPSISVEISEAEKDIMVLTLGVDATRDIELV